MRAAASAAGCPARPGGEHHLSGAAPPDARRLVVERGLVAEAVGLLTARALGGLAFERLGPTKALLKRFFSSAAWAPADDDELAGAVGPGDGRWSEALDGDLTLSFGWEGGRFHLAVEGGPVGTTAGAAPAEHGWEATFSGPVVPEATPNPRSIAFRTGRLHDGDSRSYRSAAEATDDPRVAGLFEAFPDLADVLVARDFVALTLGRADRWEALLPPVLEAVASAFVTSGDGGGAGEPPAGRPAPSASGSPLAGAGLSGEQRETRLDRAWRQLGGLRAGQEDDLARIVAATAATDATFRQVAAGLLGDGPAAVARDRWDALSQDASRRVRRAAVDAMVDAGREELRPLLERALGDDDAWVRWKALRGLSELGPGPSRPAIETLSADTDFRVRLEAHAALRRP